MPINSNRKFSTHQFYFYFPQDNSSLYSDILEFVKTGNFTDKTDQSTQTEEINVAMKQSWMYQCVFCNIQFPSLKLLKIHKRTHKGPNPFICDICGIRFTSLDRLQHHKSKHKPVETISLSAAVPSVKQAHPVDENSICSSSSNFSSLRSTIRHESNQTVEKIHYKPTYHTIPLKLTNQSNNVNVKHKDSKNVKKKTSIKPYKCRICGEQFAFSSQLYKHRENHAETMVKIESEESCDTQTKDCLENIFQCAICDRTFSKVGNLQRHQFTHTQQRPFMCKLCNKGFVSLYYLNRHCSTNCQSNVMGQFEKSKKLQDSVESDGHLVKQEEYGEDLFCCAICNRSFSKIGNLERHQSVHHNRNSFTPNKAHNGHKPFKCGICHEVFVFGSQLKRHMKIHPEQTALPDEHAFLCSICGKGFIKIVDLQSHQSIHSCEEVHQCNICMKKFASVPALRRHRNSNCEAETKKVVTVDRDLSFKNKCNECGESFTKKADYSDHLRSHLGIAAYKCGVCNQEFTFSSELYKHRKTHAGVVVKDHPNSSKEIKSSGDPVDNIFKCAICDRSFSKLGNLERHQSIHDVGKTVTKKRGHTGLRPYRCGVCGEEYEVCSQLKKHFENHPKEEVQAAGENNKNMYLCGICYQDFQTLDKLQSHQFIHRSAQPNQCEVCGKSFASIYYLKSHVKRHLEAKSIKNKGEKSEVICEVCGEKFARTNELTLHKRKTNHIVGLLKCEICSEMFATATSLSTHRKEKHIDVRPHTCEICGKSFSRSASLNIHKKTHNFPGERPYVCDICGKGYRSQEAFKYHKMRHTGTLPYKCGTCDKRFSSKSALKIHVWLHSGEKPCKCKICGKGFAQVINLKAHQRLHTGSKPYKCHICSVSFTYRTQLKRHEKRHQSSQIGENYGCPEPKLKTQSLPLNTETIQSDTENVTDGQIYRVITRPDLHIDKEQLIGKANAYNERFEGKPSVHNELGDINYYLPNILTQKRQVGSEDAQAVYHMRQIDQVDTSDYNVGQTVEIVYYQNTN